MTDSLYILFSRLSDCSSVVVTVLFVFIYISPIHLFVLWFFLCPFHLSLPLFFLSSFIRFFYPKRNLKVNLSTVRPVCDDFSVC